MPFIRIEGIIEVDDETSHEAFVELFLAWLEEHDWDFEGQTGVTDDEAE